MNVIGLSKSLLLTSTRNVSSASLLARNANLKPFGIQAAVNLRNRNYHTSSLNLRKAHQVPSTFGRYVFPKPPAIISEEEHDAVVSKVNECIAKPDRGRLFAVVSFQERQFKITEDDLISTTCANPLPLGATIQLEKVLLVGGRDFSLVGRPLVNRDLVKVTATVVEKTPGADSVRMLFKKRARWSRKYVHNEYITVLRINSIETFPEA